VKAKKRLARKIWTIALAAAAETTDRAGLWRTSRLDACRRLRNVVTFL
jgi:hypothetical protein